MAYVKDCLDTGWVSSVGKYVDRFEDQLAEFTGAKRVVAVVNGTAALHMALQLSGVRAGDEVLVPALTFVATANAVSYCGAIPHFVDIEGKTLGLDPNKLEAYLADHTRRDLQGCQNRTSGRIIRAVVAVHTFGHPVDLDPLLKVCRRFHLELIEDAAESLGSYYKGRHTGNWGRCAILSFNGNKTLTTGGGGAIMSNDEELARRAKHLTTTARVPHPWEVAHDEIGYNYRLPNINAALGCAQLEQMPGFLIQKRQLAQRYAQVFQGLEGADFFTEPDFARSNYWLNVLLLKNNRMAGKTAGAQVGLDSPAVSGASNEDLHALRQIRDKVLEVTHDHGIMTRPAWRLMHHLPMYRDCPRMDLSVAEKLESCLVNLPSSTILGAPYV